MNNYTAIEKCKSELDHIESTLKAVRDNTGTAEKKEINLALTFCHALYENLNGIDKSLEKNKSGNFNL